MGRPPIAHRAVFAATLLAVVLGLIACGGDSSRDDRTPDTTRRGGGATPSPAPTRASDAGSKLPAELVGTWIATDSGGAELVYEFTADGTYRHAAVLLQPREAGMFSFTIGARGIVTVDGRRLVLEPQSGNQEIKDPDDASRSSKRSIDRAPQAYAWTIDSLDSGITLRLTDASGLTIAYDRR